MGSPSSAAILLAVGFVVSIANCLAQEGSRNLLDLEREGSISFEEFVHRSAVQAMRELDRDGDQFISREEAGGRNPPADPDPRASVIEFSSADVDGDGRLSLDELKRAFRDDPAIRSRFGVDMARRDGSFPARTRRESVIPQFRFEF